MSEKKPTPFNFWWPTSETGSGVMGSLLMVIGVLLFVKGCADTDLLDRVENHPTTSDPSAALFAILFFYVGLGGFSWYFIINIGRLVFARINPRKTIQAMQETQREKAELETLRRRSEIKKLKGELGGVDND